MSEGWGRVWAPTKERIFEVKTLALAIGLIVGTMTPAMAQTTSHPPIQAITSDQFDKEWAMAMHIAVEKNMVRSDCGYDGKGHWCRTMFVTGQGDNEFTASALMYDSGEVSKAIYTGDTSGYSCLLGQDGFASCFTHGKADNKLIREKW